MLNIRLSRTGKTRQPSFSIVVQEHTAAVKGKFIEEIGHYHPATPSKDFKINSERAKYWLSVGAQPSDTMAVLLKKQGFEGMEKFIEPRNKKRKSSASKASATDASNASVPTASPQPQSSPVPPETSATTIQPSPSASETSTLTASPQPSVSPKPQSDSATPAQPSPNP